MANNRKVVLFVEDNNEFDSFRLTHFQWRLSDIGFELAYFIDKYLGNIKKCSDSDVNFSSILEAIEKLTDECSDFSPQIISDTNNQNLYSDGNIFGLAIHAANSRIKNTKNEEIQFRILHLIEKMYLKSSETIRKRCSFLEVPESLWELIINKNDIKLINGILPLVPRYDRNQLFKWSLLYGTAMAHSILAIDKDAGHERWLKKWGAWPLRETINNEQNNLEPANSSLEELALNIALNFPMDEDASAFNLLFPFCNEYNYKKVIDKITLLNKLEKTNVIENKNQNKIGVCLLFGESHFLSLLKVVQQRTRIIILADIVEKQWKHLKHMLICLDQSETPADFIKAYINDNPILNETVGDKKIRVNADVNYLSRNIKGGGSVENYNFLYSLDNFKECKEAAKKLIFVQVKLNLMDEHACQQFNSLLISHHAIITLCNLTNIHDYDTEDKLSKSVPLLLQSSSQSLVMHATGDVRNDLKTHLSLGLKKYFISSLKKPFNPPVNISAVNNEFSNEKNTAASLSTISSKTTCDPMLGVGMFSQTTTLKFISIRQTRKEQIKQSENSISCKF